MKLLTIYSKYLLKLLPIQYISIQKNFIEIYVSFSKINEILKFFKYHTNTQYSILTDIICYDYLLKKNRFIITYNLLSIIYNHRIFITVELNLLQEINSITNIFKNANWYEREIWDLFGVFFKNHPDLRRILTDYGFEQNPLKKSFPLSGQIEIYYNESKKQVDYRPINLSQNFRLFSINNNY